MDWLREISKRTKLKKVIKEHALITILRIWTKAYPGGEAAIIASLAKKVMEVIIKHHPRIGKFL